MDRALPVASEAGALGSVELARLYASAQWIGHGVGAALLNACLGAARERAGTTMWLGVWERNRRAIRFYEKAGFVPVGEQIFQLGGDMQRDLVMARPIERPAQA